MKQSNNNFDLLVEYITDRVLEWIMQEQNIGLEEALLLFHNSETFDKLCEKRTDLYIESPAYIYDLLKDELRRGTLRGMTE